MITLFEKFIAKISEPGNYSNLYDIYKNPKNIKNFAEECRGIIDKNVNLFVVDSSDILHYNLYEHLLKMGYIEFVKFIYEYPEILVPVQRLGNSNEFYIGEGYSKIFDEDNFFRVMDIDKFLNNIQKTLNNAKNKNPNLDFKIQSISDAIYLT